MYWSNGEGGDEMTQSTTARGIRGAASRGMCAGDDSVMDRLRRLEDP